MVRVRVNVFNTNLVIEQIEELIILSLRIRCTQFNCIKQNPKNTFLVLSVVEEIGVP
jgi:hypothetical protein